MSRHHVESTCGRYYVCYGKDDICGSFYQLYDREFEDDPSGEGIILDIDGFSGISQNFTGIPPNTGCFHEGLDVLMKYIGDNNIIFHESSETE